MNIDVGHIAHLARLTITAEESEKFSQQLSSILEYVKKLEEIDTSGVEPTSHLFGVSNVMREDSVRPPLSKDEALMNAPDRSGDFYRVLKIIE
ncbi:MAG: Asp-tRNA(Asn)/Glu-tRNA(Gln) amidotransferase subunit GatC [Nitrospirota bacterium]